MLTLPAALEKALPPAQLAAATNTRPRPSGVTEASVWATITTSPTAARARATSWKLRIRSLTSHPPTLEELFLRQFGEVVEEQVR